MELTNPVEIKETNTGHFSDHLDVLKHLSKVHHGLKKEISSDYVLAKLDEEQRTFIIEQIRNALIYKAMIENMADEVHKRREYTKAINKEDGIIESEIETIAWIKEEESIRLVARRTFDIMLAQTHMIATLHRNIIGNTILELLGRPQEIMHSNPLEEEKGFLQKLFSKKEETSKEGEKK